MNETETWFAMQGSRVVFHDANICFRDGAGSFKSAKSADFLAPFEDSDQKWLPRKAVLFSGKVLGGF